MLKDNAERGKNVIIAFWILFGLTLVSLVSTYFEHNLLVQARTGTIDTGSANANDLRQRVIGSAEFVARIVVIVLFMIWFRRCYYNVRSLGFNTQYTDGWAVGAWFVPFMNLFAPYQIMKEIWNDTQAKAQENSPDPRFKSHAILRVWWILWIVSNVAGRFYIRLLFSEKHSLEDAISTDKVDMILDVLNLVSIILIIEIIDKVRKFEVEMNHAIMIENIAAEEPVA